MSFLLRFLWLQDGGVGSDATDMIMGHREGVMEGKRIKECKRKSRI